MKVNELHETQGGMSGGRPRNGNSYHLCCLSLTLGGENGVALEGCLPLILEGVSVMPMKRMSETIP